AGSVAERVNPVVRERIHSRATGGDNTGRYKPGIRGSAGHISDRVARGSDVGQKGLDAIHRISPDNIIGDRSGSSAADDVIVYRFGDAFGGIDHNAAEPHFVSGSTIVNCDGTDRVIGDCTGLSAEIQ